MQAGLYRHYKGGFYQVLGIAAHSETEEEFVVYISLDPKLPGPRMRVRPILGTDGFQTPVDNPTYRPNSMEQPLIARFNYIHD